MTLAKRLVAVGAGVVERRAAGIALAGQLILAVEFELGAGDVGLVGKQLRLRLVNRGLPGLDLFVEASERGLLGRDLALGGAQRQRIVAIVDAGDDIAGLHRLVGGDLDAGDVAADLGGEDRGVRADIGVIGRDLEAADLPPVQPVIAATGERGDEQRTEHQRLARALLRRSGDGRFRCRRSRRLGFRLLEQGQCDRCPTLVKLGLALLLRSLGRLDLACLCHRSAPLGKRS